MQSNYIFRAVRMKDVNTFLSEMRSSSSEEVEVSIKISQKLSMDISIAISNDYN